MNQDLVSICKAVRDRQVDKWGSVEGSCKEVTLAIAYEAAKAGISTCICCGSYDGNDHYWIRHENSLYDATASQFGKNEEVLVVKESEATSYSESFFIYVNAGFVTTLFTS